MVSGPIQTYLTFDGVRRGLGWNNVTSPPTATIFGFNTNEFDTFNQTLAGRQAWWNNRAPMVRRYNPGFVPTSWSIGTSVAPEKRVCYSFKPNNPGTQFDRDDIANGVGNTRFRDFIRTIPTGWHVDLCYNHEPNDEIRSWNANELTSGGVRKGISHTQFVNGYDQLYGVLKAERLAGTLNAGATIHLVANFMAFKLEVTGTGPTDPGAYFNDAWVPSLTQMDYLTFDIYGNPGQQTSATGTNTYGTGTGTGLGTTYPLPNARAAAMFNIIQRLGWQSRWGVLEVNSPRRSWDLSEISRSRWLVDFYNMLIAPPLTPAVAPHMVLLWEAPSGANWDQAFHTTRPVDALRPYIEGSP